MSANSRFSALTSAGEFPDFRDGDVFISLGNSTFFQLHSTILKAASPIFEQLLAEDYIARPTSGNPIRSHLVAIPNTNRMVIYPKASRLHVLLVPCVIDNRGDLTDTLPVPRFTPEGMREAKPYLSAWENIFRALYGRPVDLGDWQAGGLGEILPRAVYTVEIADYLGVEDSLTSPVEASLLACGQSLFLAISRDPIIWLNFAYHIRSRPIFHEALVHAAGKYRDPEVQEALEDGLSPRIKEVLQRKGEQLIRRVQRAQGRILTFYPRAMHHARDPRRTDADTIGRAAYGNKIFLWMAMSIFRHWLTEKIVNDATHHAQDLGFAVFSLMHEGGDAYLTRTHVAELSDMFPLTGRGRVAMEDKLSGFKTWAKLKYVDPLFQNTCQLDTVAAPVEHFTCARVQQEDYPFGTMVSTDDEEEGEE